MKTCSRCSPRNCVLQARTGPRPWDLRDDPPNGAFLAAMRDTGLDPAPWLDDATTTVVTPDGQPLALALCSDPLEVFAMGAHFETCLSPLAPELRVRLDALPAR